MFYSTCDAKRVAESATHTDDGHMGASLLLVVRVRLVLGQVGELALATNVGGLVRGETGGHSGTRE